MNPNAKLLEDFLILGPSKVTTIGFTLEGHIVGINEIIAK
jgi:hypothetical protein